MTIGVYKKEIIKKIARVQYLTLSLSQWILKTNTDKIWLCESVGKLKGVVHLATATMNELRIHMIAYLQLHVRHCGKVPIQGFGQIYTMALRALPGIPLSSFKDHKITMNRQIGRASCSS